MTKKQLKNIITLLEQRKELIKVKHYFKKDVQKKNLYPNTWDIAVGGHISAGEDDITSTKRELEEELGLNLKKLKIDRVAEKLNNNRVISNEYVSIFIVYTSIDINDIKLQAEEVREARWCTK